MNLLRLWGTVAVAAAVSSMTSSIGFATQNRSLSHNPVSGIWHLFLLAAVVAVSNVALHGQSSDSTFRLVTSIPVQSKFIAVDQLEQLYVVSKENQIKKYDVEGQELFQFSNNRLGDISFIDATNPFNLLMFFSEFNEVQTLDRTLSKTGTFQLIDAGIFETEAVGLSTDNQLWVFDNYNFVLKKINEQEGILVKSDNVNLVLGRVVKPNFLLEKNNFVYVNDSETGILIFDVFGKYIKTLDFLNIEYFQISGDKLIFFLNGKLNSFNLKSLLTQTMNLPEKIANSEQIILTKKYLFARKGEAIEIYSY